MKGDREDTHTHICYFWIYLTLWFGEGNGTPLQYSCLENPMDGGAWWAAVHGVAKSRARLSDFTFTFHFHALEKEVATHSSILAWTIPGTGEPDGLPTMGSRRVGHDWSDLAAAAAALWLTFCKSLELQLSSCPCNKTLGYLKISLNVGAIRKWIDSTSTSNSSR